LKQAIEGVFLYKVFAGKGRRSFSGKEHFLFSGSQNAQNLAKSSFWISIRVP